MDEELAGLAVALAPAGQALDLASMHVADPLPALLCRVPDAGVVGLPSVAQGVHVRAVLVDPCPQLIASAHGAVTWDEHIDVVRHGFEQLQRTPATIRRSLSRWWRRLTGAGGS